MEIEILKPELEKFIPKRIEPYHPTGGVQHVLELAMETRLPILLEGPKGIGKTLAVAYFAYSRKIPLIQVDCSESTKRGDLLGRYVLVGNEVKFVLGLLPLAIEFANEYGEAVLLFEELNALPSNMQKMLNSILDWRGSVIVPEINKKYELENDKKLLIAATQNPSTYAGTFELNEDLKSRFLIMKMSYPKSSDEEKIIKIHVDVDREFVNRLRQLSMLKEMET